MSMDKKELKGPDAFISLNERIFAWIEDHAQTVGLAVALAIVLSLGWVGYSYVRSLGEAKAANALAAPEAELKKAETKVRDERAKKMADLASGKDKAKKMPDPEQVRPTDFAKDYRGAVDKVKEAIRAYADSKAAIVSALNLSYFLTQQKQFGEALDVLRLPNRKPSASDVLGGFQLMHQGLLLVENEKYDDAIKIYDDVLASKTLASFHPEALLKLGLAHELKGETEKARQTYEKLAREFPQSEASTSAQQYLRLLDLKGKQG